MTICSKLDSEILIFAFIAYGSADDGLLIQKITTFQRSASFLLVWLHHSRLTLGLNGASEVELVLILIFIIVIVLEVVVVVRVLSCVGSETFPVQMLLEQTSLAVTTLLQELGHWQRTETDERARLLLRWLVSLHWLLGSAVRASCHLKRTTILGRASLIVIGLNIYTIGAPDVGSLSLLHFHLLFLLLLLLHALLHGVLTLSVEGPLAQVSQT